MKEKSNKQFMILSAIGIIQVVMCHLAPDVKLTGYIFPYTSFLCLCLCLYQDIFIL